MPFITIPGLTGKIYIPKADALAPRKHPCPDCFSCQACSDDRCKVCLKLTQTSFNCHCAHEKADQGNVDLFKKN